MISRGLWLVCCALLVVPSFVQTSQPATAESTGVVFLVRHAERTDTGMKVQETDPHLSTAGHARAQALAALLRDAGIRAIFVSQYHRTQETAAPLAKALSITPTVINSKDQAGLVAGIKAARGNVLVVGHSNSVPGTIKALGVAEPVTIRDDEFDHLFLVTPAKQLVTLRYHTR